MTGLKFVKALDQQLNPSRFPTEFSRVIAWISNSKLYLAPSPNKTSTQNLSPKWDF